MPLSRLYARIIYSLYFHHLRSPLNRRTVFFVSDRTGITVETLGHSLTSQFDNIDFHQITIPFVDSTEKAIAASEQIRQAGITDQQKPIVFGTIIPDNLRAIIAQSGGVYIDFVHTFIGPLEKELGTPSNHTVGRSHGVRNLLEYHTRMEAVNFALQYDDGGSVRGYHSADVILIGVSRCGKTPTCVYLGMQYGIRAANYPLTEEDIEKGTLPDLLKPHLSKLVGLTIDPMQLHAIRTKRRPDSPYAAAQQCAKEVRIAEMLFHQENIPFLNSTHSSIEELAVRIIGIRNLTRHFQ